MKRVTTILIALGCSALAYAQPATGPDSIDFNLKFTVGRVTRLRMLMKTVGTMKMPDPFPEQKIAQTMEELMIMECRQVNPDGSAVFDMTFGEMAMRMNMGLMTVEFDSRRPRATTQPSMLDSIGRVFSAMIGQKITLVMSNTGQPIKVEGLKEALKKALAAGVDKDTPAMITQMLDQITDLFGDDSMNQQLRTCSRILPPRTGIIRIGEQWQNQCNQKLANIGAMNNRGEYQLVGVERIRGRDCAKVRIKETVSMASAASSAPAPGPKNALAAMMDQVDLRMNSTGGSGIAYFDYHTGELVQLRQTMDFTLEIGPKTTAKPAGENQVPIPRLTQKMRNSISIDLEEPGAQPAPAAVPGS